MDGLEFQDEIPRFPPLYKIFFKTPKKFVPWRGPNDITNIEMHEKRTEKGKEGQNWKGG
jgi:hypothetical protein